MELGISEMLIASTLVSVLPYAAIALWDRCIERGIRDNRHYKRK
jgi:hypothetical protein